jgi:hypothetical protein
MGTRSFTPLALFLTAVVACSDNVPDDPGARIYAASGVIQGTILYQGPHPCSFNGHIVGNAILLIFDQRNLPPPNGLAVLPSNFVDVTGDVLFGNEPRYTGTDAVYCPKDHGFTDTITVSAPFAVSPMSAATYVIEGFFDYTGDFLPTFKFRELPERNDIAGGDVDTADALKPINSGNPDYSPHFIPVVVGTQETPAQYNPGNATLPPGYIPPYDMPSQGYVAHDVTVSLGSVLTNTRPYFYAYGLPYGNGMPYESTISADGLTINNTTPDQESDVPWTTNTGAGTSADSSGPDPADYVPILKIPQDIQTLSAPNVMDTSAPQQNVNLFEAVLPHLNLKFGVASDEAACAAPVPGSTTNPCSSSGVPAGQNDPFNFQLTQGSSQGTFSVWQNAYFDPATQTWNPLQIPEGNNAPMLWPEVILSKLIDSNPSSTPVPHVEDPASLTAQGAAGQPVVIMQGITLLGPAQTSALGSPAQADTLYNTVSGEGSNQLFIASGISPGPFTPFDPSCATASPGPNCYNGTLFNYQTGQPTVFTQDHLTVALRPAVICFAHLFDNPPALDTRGTIVTPFSGGPTASAPQSSMPDTAIGPIVPTDILSNGDVDHRYQVTNLVNGVQFGCLPKGRYAINVVYPNGQAWTVPNESGACSGTEGTTVYDGSPTGLTCTLKPRPVLYSQGNRAVVEVVDALDSKNCVNTNGPPASTTFTANTIPQGTPAPAVPVACLPRCETVPCTTTADTCTPVPDPNNGGAIAMVCLPP